MPYWLVHILPYWCTSCIPGWCTSGLSGWCTFCLSWCMLLISCASPNHLRPAALTEHVLLAHAVPRWRACAHLPRVPVCHAHMAYPWCVHPYVCISLVVRSWTIMRGVHGLRCWAIMRGAHGMCCRVDRMQPAPPQYANAPRHEHLLHNNCLCARGPLTR